MRIVLAFVFLLSLALGSGAQSPVQQQTNPGEPKGETDAPRKDNQGAERLQTPPTPSPLFLRKEPLPFVINVSSEKGAKHPEKCAEGESWKDYVAFLRCRGIESDYFTPEWVTAAFTVVLAFSTILLYVATMGAAKGAKQAAEAAKIALIGLDRPYLFIGEIGPYVTRMHNIPFYPYVDYSIENHGRAPAIIKSRKISLLLVDEIPKRPPYDKIPSNQDYTVLSAEARLKNIVARVNTPADKAGVDRIRSKAVRCLFVGIIEYEDVFGKVFETGFGYVYEPSDGTHVSNDAFVACDYPGYNYHRRIKRRKA